MPNSRCDERNPEETTLDGAEFVTTRGRGVCMTYVAPWVVARKSKSSLTTDGEPNERRIGLLGVTVSHERAKSVRAEVICIDTITARTNVIYIVNTAEHG